MRQFYLPCGSYARYLFTCLITAFIFHGVQSQPIVSFSSKITGLTSPVDIVNAGDNSNRIFVVQQNGTIKVFDQALNPLGDFLNVSTSFNSGERGLLSMAFHPDYATNGFFFVYYTNAAGDIEVDRYHTPGGTPNTADPASRQQVIVIPHPTNNNHNGGKLNFGSDGYLYFATGDGGGGGDVPNNAQTGTVLLGKMIRINVSTGATAPFYTIPPDNPFLVPGDNINDEIWSFGLRNPFRWSFDRLTHDMWIGDVGQDAYEEIDFNAAGTTGGLNYGWHCIEGTHPYTPAGACTLSAGTYAAPLLDYPHSNLTGGRAVIGGYVYRGTLNPAMYGYYIFGDETSGNVWLLPPNGTAADTIQFSGAAPGLSAFGEAENGELYSVAVTNGQLYSVTATNGALPVKLISFWGMSKNGFDELTWITANEVQFHQFDIETSADGTHFEKVGTVPATGSPSYAFRHASSGLKSFYRLKLVDIDGKYVYSKSIVIANNAGSAGNFATPSVISNGQVSVKVEGPYTKLEVVNMDGKLVHRESIITGNNRMNLQLTGVPAGQYIIRLIGTSKQVMQKIIVQ